MEQIDIDININMNNVDEVDELTIRLQEATDGAGTLSDTLDGISFDGSSVDTEPLNEELTGATAEADSLQGELYNISNTSINLEINIDNRGIDETKDKIQETESSASSLGTALSGLAGMIGVDQMISTADNIEMSWNRLKLTFGKVSQSLKNNISSAAEATGRSGGQVRDYFNQMGIAGIKNGDLLESSFKSMAGAAVQLKVPLESVQGAMQRMVMTGNASDKLLRNLGLTAEDLGRAMGMSADEAQKAFESLDQEGRLQALTTAMGDGTEANEMYKHSYAGLKDKAEAAMAGLMGAIGEGILPVINPMIEGATNVVKGLTDAFKSLPGPVKGVVGSFGGFLAVGTTIIGVLGTVGKAVKGVTDGLKHLSKLSKISSSLSTLKTTLSGVASQAKKTALSLLDVGKQALIAGWNALKSVGSWVAQKAAMLASAVMSGIQTAATWAVTAAQTALYFVMNMNPIFLVIMAIVALVAILWHLYNTNESVRNGINGLIAGLKGFIQNIIATGQGVFQFVITSISRLAQFPAKVKQIFTKVISIAISWATSFVQKGWNAAINFVNRVKSGVGRITGAISSALSGVYNAITAPFRRAYDFVMNNVIRPIQNAWNWISSFGSYQGYAGYEGYGDVLNDVVYESSNQDNTNGMVVNNNFNGIVEDSVADYIIDTVNDKLRREKLLRGI